LINLLVEKFKSNGFSNLEKLYAKLIAEKIIHEEEKIR
jgi:hypothetical protein